jgi:hypothetical protein
VHRNDENGWVVRSTWVGLMPGTVEVQIDRVKRLFRAHVDPLDRVCG